MVDWARSVHRIRCYRGILVACCIHLSTGYWVSSFLLHHAYLSRLAKFIDKVTNNESFLSANFKIVYVTKYVVLCPDKGDRNLLNFSCVYQPNAPAAMA